MIKSTNALHFTVSLTSEELGALRAHPIPRVLVNDGNAILAHDRVPSFLASEVLPIATPGVPRLVEKLLAEHCTKPRQLWFWPGADGSWGGGEDFAIEELLNARARLYLLTGTAYRSSLIANYVATLRKRRPTLVNVHQLEVIFFRREAARCKGRAVVDLPAIPHSDPVATVLRNGSIAFRVGIGSGGSIELIGPCSAAHSVALRDWMLAERDVHMAPTEIDDALAAAGVAALPGAAPSAA